MINDVIKVKKSVDVIKESEEVRGRQVIAKPMDSQILSDSVRILQSLYSPALRDQTKEDTANVYLDNLHKIVGSNQTNRSWTEPEYEYIRYCFGKDSPLGKTDIEDFRSFFETSNVQSACLSTDYAQYLRSRKDSDTDFVMPKYKHLQK